MNAKRFSLTLVAVCLSLSVAEQASAYYAAHMGRWLTRDPNGEIGRFGMAMPPDRASMGFVDRDQFNPMVQYEDGMNLYQYVKSSPVRFGDPSGLAMSHPRPKPGIRYFPETQCVENGKVVEKVSVWICERPLDIPPIAVGIIDFLQLDHIPPQDYELSHSYVCCDGPNMKCFGKQSTTKVGDPIPVEMLATGSCYEKKVCPAFRKDKCDCPISKKPYSIPCRDACHDWAYR